MRKQQIRAITISFFVIAVSFFNFTSLSGTECVRAIHVFTLLLCGMGIGIFLKSLIGLLSGKKN